MTAHNNAHAVIYLGLIAGAVVIIWRLRTPSAPSVPSAPTSSASISPFQTGPTINNFQVVGGPQQGQYYPLALGYMPLFGFVGVRAF